MDAAIPSVCATFHFCDLHVHTRYSADVDDLYGSLLPEDLVRQALAAGLSAIAITDHNTSDGCDEITLAAQGTGLVVLPGVEISTAEGHLLAIFDEGTSSRKIRELLIKVGFIEPKYGRLDGLAIMRMEEVAAEIVMGGGIAIPAHVDGPNGISTRTEGLRRSELFASSHFSAFEIARLEKREEMNAKAGRSLTFIQGSDCSVAGEDGHRLTGIGSRSTRIKAGRPSLRALKHAISDPEMRLKLSCDVTTTSKSFIEGVKITGGFLHGANFTLSQDLNCLIGGTGTGKSLTLELLRFCLDQQSSTTVIRTEVYERLKGALGNDASITMTLRKDGALFNVSRGWANGAASESVVSSVDAFGTLNLVAMPIKELFPIVAFSQGEVIEYARQPVARLTLIDEALDLTTVDRNEQEFTEQLLTNGNDLISQYDKIAAAELTVARMSETRERISSLSKFFDAELVKSQASWEQERHRIDAAEAQLDRFSKSFMPIQEDEISAVQPLDPATQVLEVKTINSALLEELDQIIHATQIALSAQAAEAAKLVLVARDRLMETRAKWTVLHEAYNQSVHEALTNLAGEGAKEQSLRVELERLQQDELKIGSEQVHLDNDLRPRLVVLLATRERLLDSLQATRKQRRVLREERVSALNIKIGGTVRLKIVNENDDKLFREHLLRLKIGSRLSDEAIDKIAQACHPIPLVKSLLSDDYSGVPNHLDVAHLQRLRQSVLERGLLEELYALQVIKIEDTLSIRFSLSEGEYRDIEALAHGQKCTAILVIVMADGTDPVIVDQPEDALHAPWIEEYLVGRLRSVRGERQFIFATRSPGIVVSADAEQVIALEADANRGTVTKAGSLEDFTTTELVLHHVEGGREPFVRRHGKLVMP